MTEIDRHGNEKHGEHASCISAAAEAASYLLRVCNISFANRYQMGLDVFDILRSHLQIIVKKTFRNVCGSSWINVWTSEVL